MPSRPPKDFGIYILTHRRPERQQQSTVRLLERVGYTGPWYLVVDDEDPTLDEYLKIWGTDRVIVFPKQATIDSFDIGDNFGGSGSVVPRAAIWDIARNNGHRWHMQLDDDYSTWVWRTDHKYQPLARTPLITDLNKVLQVVLKWFKTTPPELSAVCFGQGGDFFGGITNPYLRHGVKTQRKAMNTWICDTERQFTFPGRRNEDVNAYTELQRRGTCFLTTFQISIFQQQTQNQPGGMTEMYEKEGTYLKSFTSVMRCPSGVKISHIADRNLNPRIHHRVTYNHVAPKFVPVRHQKAR